MMQYKEIPSSIIYNAKPQTYDYGCVMLYFQFVELSTMHYQINPNHLYTLPGDKGKFGLESEPHCTLLYGLHDGVGVDKIASALGEIVYSECTISNISLFENAYDVLKFDVSGDSLIESNKILRRFPYTTDYPIYHPHMTIAYLKSGFGKRYVDKFKNNQYKLKPKHLIYTIPNGKKYQIECNIK